jgi:hypothetical protein
MGMIANGLLTLSSLSDINRSTAANDGQESTLSSAPKNSQRIPYSSKYASGIRGLRPFICLPLHRLVTNGNVGQAVISQFYEQQQEGTLCTPK